MPQYPAVGSRCTTRHGTGRISRVDIFREEISILLEDAGEIKMSIGEMKRAKSRGKFVIHDSPAARETERAGGLEDLEG